jgi:hypothetical protein
MFSMGSDSSISFATVTPAQRHLHRLRKLVYAALQRSTRIRIELQFLRSHGWLLLSVVVVSS